MGSTARWLRRFLPMAILASVAVGSWSAAGAIDRDEASTEPVPYDLVPVDPVLSARRIPRALRAPIAEAALRPQLQAVIDASPPDTCLVVETEDRSLFALNPSQPVIPASNQKLLTTWAALETLGEEASFRTTVVTDAPRDGGVLDGDLWLVGDGDPFLTTDEWIAQFEDGPERVRTRLEDLADAVVAAGITEVRGSVVGDESRYDTQRSVATWDQRLVDQNQSGPLSALMVDEGIARFPDQYSSRLGYQPAADPAVHAAQVFSRLLGERGVTVVGAPASGAAPATAVEVAAVSSPPLSTLVRGINAWSDNAGAELLLKELDQSNGGAGTTAGGAAIVAGRLAAAGLPMAGVVVNDGSGLDETDRVTCDLLASILARAGDESVLARSLAVSGSRGSLRSRFTGTAAEGRVRAKTGTLRSVTAISGYVDSATEAGTSLIFSYVANVREADGVVEQRLVELQQPLVLALTSYPAGPTVSELDPRDPVPAG